MPYELLLLAAAFLLGVCICIPPLHQIMRLAAYLQESR